MGATHGWWRCSVIGKDRITRVVIVSAIAIVILTSVVSFSILKLMRGDEKVSSRDWDFYLSSNAIHEPTPTGVTFVFVGHVKLFNDPDNPWADHGPGFDGLKEKLDYFVTSAMDLPVSRVVFGGDTVRTTENRNALKYIIEDLAPRFEGLARFLHGNHDPPTGSSTSGSDLFKAVFPSRFYFEDVGKTRLVYLQSEVPLGFDQQQLEFLRTVLESDSYQTALVFLHHAFWYADEPEAYANEPFFSTSKMPKQYWVTQVLPLLRRGRVGGVFAGDGGGWRSGIVTTLCGIPHYLTGWDRDRHELPAGFLQIVVDGEDVEVLRQVMFDNRLYHMPVEEVLLQMPDCQ